MPRLIVKSSATKNQRFELDKPETLVGRGDECQLVLPNVSVSRQHARVLVGTQGVTIEDLGSASGIVVNGKRIQQHMLSSGDEIQIGKFSLVFMGDGRQDRFYKGRFVEYLAAYEKGGVPPDDDAATFALSVEALKRLQQDNHLVDSARVVSESDRKRFWFPEDRGLSFGAAGMVQVEGWFTGGICAELSWDGRQHVITKKGWLTHVSVNGQAVSGRRPLRERDQLRIGKSWFTYEVEH